MDARLFSAMLLSILSFDGNSLHLDAKLLLSGNDAKLPTANRRREAADAKLPSALRRWRNLSVVSMSLCVGIARMQQLIDGVIFTIDKQDKKQTSIY